MPKQYPGAVRGLKMYSQRLKGFIHERCSCFPPLDDDMFEVPEHLIKDPLKRRPSIFKLSFADDYPYTRFPDEDEADKEPVPCTCKLCPICYCNFNLRPFPHYVLHREQLPQWIQKVRPLTFKRRDIVDIDTISLRLSMKMSPKASIKAKSSKEKKAEEHHEHKAVELPEETKPPETSGSDAKEDTGSTEF